jgi:hypothetical protein
VKGRATSVREAHFNQRPVSILEVSGTTHGWTALRFSEDGETKSNFLQSVCRWFI